MAIPKSFKQNAVALRFEACFSGFEGTEGSTVPQLPLLDSVPKGISSQHSHHPQRLRHPTWAEDDQLQSTCLLDILRVEKNVFSKWIHMNAWAIGLDHLPTIILRWLTTARCHASQHGLISLYKSQIQCNQSCKLKPLMSNITKSIP